MGVGYDTPTQLALQNVERPAHQAAATLPWRSTMDKLRLAAQLALETFEKFVSNVMTVGQRYTNEGEQILVSIYKLRAALAEPQGEPVATLYGTLPIYDTPPQPKAEPALKQALTDPENQPNQFGVEFLMRGPKFAFKVGVQQFTLDYEPREPGEFEFMRDMLIHAFSSFTPDVKTEPQEPVAWMITDNYERKFLFRLEKPVAYKGETLLPLYTAPQPRREVELTDEEILEIKECYSNEFGLEDKYAKDFARAVIAAYRAKQGETK
jgi:hypothetical protein